MLTVLTFVICVAPLYLFNLLFNYTSFSSGMLALIITADIVLEIGINAIVATIFSKCLSKDRFKKSLLNHVSKRETRFYEKLGIKKWKDKVLELGALNGFRKNKMQQPWDSKYIERFISENNLGLTIHFWSMISGFAILPLCPFSLIVKVTLPVAIISLIINLQAFAILRYNAPRLNTALAFAQRHPPKATEKNNAA